MGDCIQMDQFGRINRVVVGTVQCIPIWAGGGGGWGD